VKVAKYKSLSKKRVMSAPVIHAVDRKNDPSREKFKKFFQGISKRSPPRDLEGRDRATHYKR
jgi:hypothetical protein